MAVLYQACDPAAKQADFRRVFENYKDLIFSVAYGYLKNRDDANDVMQDVFLKYYRRSEGFPDENRLRAWLVTVAANGSRNILRSGRLRKCVPIDEAHDISCEQDFGDENGVFAAVMSLPEKERIPVHLFYYGDYSTAEIAQMLAMKESTVRVRLMRGRERLKKLLNK